MLLTFQLEDKETALPEELVQVAEDPLYENVPRTETVHMVVPPEFLYAVVLDPVTVARVGNGEGWEAVSVSMVVSKYEPSSRYSMDIMVPVGSLPLAKMDAGRAMAIKRAIMVTNEIDLLMTYSLFILDNGLFFCDDRIL